MFSRSSVPHIFESKCECVNLCVPKKISNVIINDYEGFRMKTASQQSIFVNSSATCFEFSTLYSYVCCRITKFTTHEDSNFNL
jgi:hypothetical protein